MVKRLKEIQEKSTKRLVKILHINQDYQVFYCLIRNGAKIISEISLSKAIEFLNTSEFDLVLSEPQNLAILTPHPDMDTLSVIPV
ncbi:MAG: hypothetical protein C0407_10220 [Desulfobacca sp.]|nr:hypothetical protein [Desulfobacca sp.]